MERISCSETSHEDDLDPLGVYQESGKNEGTYDTSDTALNQLIADCNYAAEKKDEKAARNVIIHNPEDGTGWDVESWIAGLSNDPEIVLLLWQIWGAINRPFVSWDKSAWFYSTEGCSGKGTFCELLRNLCGKDYYASISLEEFTKASI